jgi:hypothetical protein
MKLYNACKEYGSEYIERISRGKWSTGLSTRSKNCLMNAFAPSKRSYTRKNYGIIIDFEVYTTDEIKEIIKKVIIDEKFDLKRIRYSGYKVEEDIYNWCGLGRKLKIPTKEKLKLAISALEFCCTEYNSSVAKKALRKIRG